MPSIQPRDLRKDPDDRYAARSRLMGLPTLSVKSENRRQVFAESEYDQSCHQELFRLLRAALSTPYFVEFIASGHASIPKFVLDMSGHDWEQRMKDEFLPLRQYGKKIDARSGAAGYSQLPTVDA